jgi:hypothetical protein
MMALEWRYRACRVVHKAAALCRLATWCGWALMAAVPHANSDKGGGFPRSVLSAHPPNLAMILSGARFVDKDSACGDDPATTRHGPLLHVNYAYRRWMSREALLAIQILYSGILSSSQFREAWEPLLTNLRMRVHQMIRHSRSQPQWSESNNRNPGIQQNVMGTCDQAESPHHATRIYSKNKPNLESTQHRACPSCGTYRIQIPFRAACGHVYCYTCLYGLSVGFVNSRSRDGGAIDGHGVESDPSQHRASIRCLVCQSAIDRAYPSQ